MHVMFSNLKTSVFVRPHEYALESVFENYLWTVAVFGEKYLCFRKCPVTCGRGLSQTLKLFAHQFQVQLKPMVGMNEKSLTGYGRGCGYESQCLSRPQICFNYWGKDQSSRNLMMEIIPGTCKVECCQKNVCHTPAEKRPKSPYRTDQSKKEIYDFYNPKKGARASSHGVKSDLHAGLLLIGLALYLLAL